MNTGMKVMMFNCKRLTKEDFTTDMGMKRYSIWSPTTQFSANCNGEKLNKTQTRCWQDSKIYKQTYLPSQQTVLHLYNDIIE